MIRSLDRFCHYLGRVAFLIILLASTAALVGWQFDLPYLQSGYPTLAPINPVVALSFLLAALGSWLLTTSREFEESGRDLYVSKVETGYSKDMIFGKLVPRGLFLLVLGVGLLKLVGVYGNWQTGVDQLLFAQKLPLPGRPEANLMAKSTAVNFLLSSLALFVLSWYGRKRFHLVQGLLFTVMGICLLSLLGYFYLEQSFQYIGPYVQMALSTTLLFLLLSVGTLLLRPHQGVVAVLLSQRAGGLIFRRLLIVTTVVPILLGWSLLFAQRRYSVGYDLSVGLLVVLIVVGLSLTVYLLAVQLNHLEEERERAHMQLVEREQVLELLNQTLEVQNQRLLTSDKEINTANQELQQMNEELRTSEEELRQSVELISSQNKGLQKLNQQLDHYIYRAGHDLRAPLMSVLGLINISRLEEDASQKEYYLDQMEKSIHRLDSFIQDIINHTRNTRTEVRKELIQAKPFVEEQLRALHHMHVLSIKTLVVVKEEANFYSDRARLSIILSNLLSNAYRYADPHREEPTVQISLTIYAQQVLLEVKDNGIGIDEEHLDKIFGMFYRASESSKGSGLGLYIVKEVVETLKGTVSANSQVGEGTTFLVTLPNSSLM